MSEGRQRARELGITIGRLPTGPHNAITDVAGIKVGHTTLIEGEGPLVVGNGPVRTGVTVVWPHSDGSIAGDPVYAGYHQLNGNGEMTGVPWIMESGLLSSPIAITNTHSVGVVRDALIQYEVERYGDQETIDWGLPVVAETYDGWLNDINGFHVKTEHVFAALDGATAGAATEGNVGGGTGMMCHEFKGGIGTSSRVLPENRGGWTVGVLVQANYGERHLLRVDGVPVGDAIGPGEVPSPVRRIAPGAGSIIIIVATDAPILPDQCRRLAQRATIGLARAGGNGNNSSGDIFLAFTTANRGLSMRKLYEPIDVRTLAPDAMTPLFAAVAEATEEAIVNAICMAETMIGRDGHTAHALPLDRLQEVWRQYGRG